MTCPMAPQWGVVPETGIEPVRPCGRGIFLPLRLSPPARERCSWSGARLHHSLAALGARRLLSTPSRFFQTGLGSALARNRSRAFAEFDGLHLWSFLQRAQISSSPLCLPISPLGHCGPKAGRQWDMLRVLWTRAISGGRDYTTWDWRCRAGVRSLGEITQ